MPPTEPVADGLAAARLAALAVQLKKAALDAGRFDVAAKADEAITLLAGAGESAGRDGKANAILQFLDGLGL